MEINAPFAVDAVDSRKPAAVSDSAPGLRVLLQRIGAVRSDEPRIDVHRVAADLGVGQLYAIVTTGRCGSTELARTLDCMGICGRPYEYFADDVIEQRLQSAGADTLRDYVGTMLARESCGGVFGFKTTPSRLFDLQAVIDLKLDEAPERIRWIDLRRRDLVAQAFSMARAVSSGVWHRVDGQARGRTVVDLPEPGTGQSITDHRVIGIMTEILEQEAAIDVFYARHTVPVLRLHYEDFVRSRQATVERVIRHVAPSCGSGSPESVPVSRVERLSGAGDAVVQAQFLARNQDTAAALLRTRSVADGGEGEVGRRDDRRRPTCQAAGMPAEEDR